MVYLCSTQLWLEQLEGWELESSEVLLIQMFSDINMLDISWTPWLWISVKTPTYILYV